MIHLLRASHANNFELQNYAPLAKQLNLQVVTSHHPLTPISLPHTQLWSPTDLPNFPFRRQLFNRLFGGEQWLLGLDRLIQPGDIVHTAETYTPYTHQAVQLKKKGVISKLVCTYWETIPHNNEKFARFRQWKREAYQYVDLFHTPTLRAKHALIAEGVAPAKIKVIPYGVNLTRFTPRQPQRNSVKVRKPVVLTVARPVAEKGYVIFQQLQHELSDLADFRWVTGVAYDQMPQVYAQADIFFLPSQTTPTWEEQYGMALIEAMATGLPIVATNTGAIPEVVGSAGILVGENDSDAMRQALTSLIENQALTKKYSTLSLARARAHYDARRIATQLTKLY